MLPVKVTGSNRNLLICVAALVLLCGCTAQTRYEVLSFFFDGVPAPEDQAARAARAGAARRDANNENERSSQHGPYAAKMCAACHDTNTNALLLPKDMLCLNCHDLQLGRRQHGPVAAGGCLVCHDPHRSSNRYLLVSPAKVFCLYCHDPKDVYERDAHQGMTASCTECHNPHGSDNEYLLR
jgi:predicted CXXCH cytochrome family protein